MIPMTTDEALEALRQELSRARAKFPGSAKRFEALCEEVGELAREFDVPAPGDINQFRLRHESIQVACVAIRLATEETIAPDACILDMAKKLELLARSIQAEQEATCPT